MKAANKILKKLQVEVVDCIPQLKDSSSFKLLAYSDSFYANLKDGGSQGGFIIFLTDADGVNLSPIAWQSNTCYKEYFSSRNACSG